MKNIEELIGYLIGIGFICGLLYGYFHNIYLLFQMEALNGMMAARIAGIFLGPLGSILGFISN